MASNSYGRFSYKDKVAYTGGHGSTYCEVSDGSKTLYVDTTDESTKIYGYLQDFKYHVDYGREAFDDAVATVTFGAIMSGLKLSAQGVIAVLIDEIKDGFTADTVIDCLKSLSSTIPVPNAFLAGDIAVACANICNCENDFKNMDRLD